jgi:hypothetical protein
VLEGARLPRELRVVVVSAERTAAAATRRWTHRWDSRRARLLEADQPRPRHLLVRRAVLDAHARAITGQGACDVDRETFVVADAATFVVEIDDRESLRAGLLRGDDGLARRGRGLCVDLERQRTDAAKGRRAGEAEAVGGLGGQRERRE